MLAGELFPVRQRRSEGIFLRIVQIFGIAVTFRSTAQVAGFTVVVIKASASAEMGRSGDIEFQSVPNVPVHIQVRIPGQIR